MRNLIFRTSLMIFIAASIMSCKKDNVDPVVSPVTPTPTVTSLEITVKNTSAVVVSNVDIAIFASASDRNNFLNPITGWQKTDASGKYTWTTGIVAGNTYYIYARHTATVTTYSGATTAIVADTKNAYTVTIQ